MTIWLIKRNSIFINTYTLVSNNHTSTIINLKRKGRRMEERSKKARDREILFCSVLLLFLYYLRAQLRLPCLISTISGLPAGREWNRKSRGISTKDDWQRRITWPKNAGKPREKMAEKLRKSMEEKDFENGRRVETLSKNEVKYSL